METPEQVVERELADWYFERDIKHYARVYDAQIRRVFPPLRDARHPAEIRRTMIDDVLLDLQYCAGMPSPELAARWRDVSRRMHFAFIMNDEPEEPPVLKRITWLDLWKALWGK